MTMRSLAHRSLRLYSAASATEDRNWQARLVPGTEADLARLMGPGWSEDSVMLTTCIQIACNVFQEGKEVSISSCSCALVPGSFRICQSRGIQETAEICSASASAKRYLEGARFHFRAPSLPGIGFRPLRTLQNPEPNSEPELRTELGAPTRTRNRTPNRTPNLNSRPNSGPEP